ncbi:MAG: YggT family protein [Candidatus Hydrothermota bacterium]|nr:MAG: YggT family protein [Candidatus Hydrothermae bacterium]
MFIIGQFFVALSKILHILINISIWVLIIDAIFSWTRFYHHFPQALVVKFLANIILNPIRRIFRPFIGYFDLSPVIAIVGLLFLDMFLVPVLMRIGWSLM